jgi:diguanylate cyclase (GGDEF)-like protein/PAS domain S-box-containing protein
MDLRSRATGVPGFRPKAWAALLVVCCAFAALYAAVPPFKGSTALMNALGLMPVLATLAGLRLHRPVARRPWLWFAAGLTLFWLGDLYKVGYPHVFDGVAPFPSVGDAAHICFYPVLMLGLLLVLRLRNPHGDSTGAIDALIITIGVSLFSWLGLIAPYVYDESMALLPKLVSIAYPLGDVLLLSAVTRLAVDGGRRGPAFFLMTLGIVSLLVTDFADGLVTLGGASGSHPVLDLGWIAFYALWGAAALHPSMRRLDQPVPGHVQRLTRGRLRLLSAATLVAPAVAIGYEGFSGDLDLIVIAAASGLLFVLVVLRMADLVRVNERAVNREQVLSAAGTALVAATDREHEIRIMLGAARELAGAGADVRLDVGGPPVAAEANGVLRLPVSVAGESRGVLTVRTGRTLPSVVRDALEALVTQVSMALEGADLAEQVAQRKSEERFAALVRHSSDLITVLTADGVVAYQSPSIRNVLGHAPEDVVGRPFVDLLDDGDSSALGRLVADGAGVATIECALRHSDGGVRQFEVQYTNLLDEEHIQGIVLNGRDISERKALAEQLSHQAFHDPLTGLANRALFAERVRHALARHRREHQSLAVLFFDLDDFKTINDSLGHAAGDEVLLEVGKRLSTGLRASDTAARFGGDEFAVLLETIGSEPEVADTAQRLIEELAAPFVVAEKELSLRSSLGIAVVTADADAMVNAEDLIRNADAAMYIAKRDGKGSYRMFEPAMHQSVLARLELRGDLERALAEGQFELHYQPLVRLTDARVVGFEALLRWNHPERGMVPPDEFIPFAEETGLIVPIGRWVVREGCRQAVALREAAPDAPPFGMSVNLSVKQLQHPQVVADVKAALADSGLDPGRLTLEITETVVMTDTDVAMARLRELKALGVRLAMDDFGTGYSSLSYLHSFPVDVLKMDRSFLRPGTSVESDNLASAVIAIGANLELQVVAEGIEDGKQWTSLRDLGCDIGQGFHFARPMDAPDAAEYLRRLAPAADVPAPAPAA